MNPWVAGRIVEQMQIEARHRARHADLAHQATRAEAPVRVAPEPAPGPEPEPRRERFGLAVARLGLRIAGRNADQIAGRRHFAGSKLEARH